ncbi:MAG: DNA translocase FtsK 4TM domain-containing protein [Methylococcales bacterium]|nr:DNA translocase FtsK 4TM domain-containing protein [Methylococcales bacterium]
MSAIIEEKTIRGLREIVFISFVTVVLFFFIALITFSIEDAGWTHSGSIQHTRNACGLVGAWISDFSLSIFGIIAYLFPVMFLWNGYLFYTQDSEKNNTALLLIKWFGFVATIVSGCSIFYLHLLRIDFELPGSPGGVLGEEAGKFLVIILGDIGATILLSAILLGGLTLSMGVSWLAVVDGVGKYALILFDFIFQQDNYQYSSRQKKPTKVSRVKGKEKRKTTKKPKKADESVVTRVKNKPLFKTTTQKEQTDLFEPAFDLKSYTGVLPPLALLDKRDSSVKGYSVSQLEKMSGQVEEVLQDFNISVEVVAVSPGPVITRFELKLAAGIKVSRISGLAKDIARGLSVTSVRVVEVIQGKSVIGLEIPNQEREMVSLRDLLESKSFERAKSKLTFAMGKDISGDLVVADLGKMPHALVAGTTGSGKSVAINTMILSLLYKATAEEVRMIMIDPKMLELSVYDGIPHLLTPVVTDMKDAQNALRWAVAEMERRYKLMSKLGVRSLAGYNQMIKEAAKAGKPILDPLFQATESLAEGEDFPTLEHLPSIVIVIDELADMMMVIGKKVEELIARLAQKARAAGIHLVLATQRPSVDVLTGLIKANVPTRISFQVSSRIDSRTILDQGGAEALLGNGDMLFLPSGTSIPIRAHGAFVDDHEVHKVVEFLKTTAPSNYLNEITQERSETGGLTSEEGDAEMDALYDEAVQFITQARKVSISSVQRRFKIGYNRAANIVEEMESSGVVSSPESNGSRQVLAPPPPKD